MDRRGFIKNLFRGTAVAGAYAAFPAVLGKGLMTMGEGNTEAEITGFENGDKSFKAVDNYAKMYDITPDNALKLLKAVQADQDAVLMAAAGGFISAGSHNAFNNGVPLCDDSLSKMVAPVASGLNASFSAPFLVIAREGFKDFPLTRPETLIDNFGMSAEKAEIFTSDHKYALTRFVTLGGFGAAFLKESQTKRGADDEAEPGNHEPEIPNATLEA